MGAKALDEFTALDRRIDAQTDAHQLNQTFIQRLGEETEELYECVNNYNYTGQGEKVECLGVSGYPKNNISESHLDSHNDRQSEQEN